MEQFYLEALRNGLRLVLEGISHRPKVESVWPEHLWGKETFGCAEAGDTVGPCLRLWGPGPSCEAFKWTAFAFPSVLTKHA